MCCVLESLQQASELIGAQHQDSQHEVAHHFGVASDLDMAGTEFVFEP